MDWGTLRCLRSRLIDPQLDKLESDLLFEVSLLNKQRMLLHVIEHQSTSDGWMALRFQGYVQKIWSDERVKHPQEHRVTAVIPIVVYHGEGPWTGARSLHELVGLGPEEKVTLGGFVPNFEFVLAGTNSPILHAAKRAQPRAQAAEKERPSSKRNDSGG